MLQGIVKNSRVFSQQLGEPDSWVSHQMMQKAAQKGQKKPVKENPAKTLLSRDLGHMPKAALSLRHNTKASPVLGEIDLTEMG